VIAHRTARPQNPARAVVIGARGFIGAALMERLRAQDVPALGLTSADLDLASPQAAEKLASVLKPADAVVMLAALTPDKGRDVATLMKNLAMMRNLCAAIEKTGCAHLVYFSSDAVYSLAVARVSEETPASPQDLYGAMHYTREIMAKGLPKVPLLVLRPTLVYGAKDTHNAYGPNRFRRAGMKEGKIQLFGDGEETRDHIHVDDVAEITVRCLRHGSTGTLNLATGRSWPFSGVARIVAKQFPRPAEIVNTPRANPITHRHYDVTDLIKAFPGYRFIALEDGVARSHRESTGAA
jgi:nucleoside-diphosphate-sugar epimerase